MLRLQAMAAAFFLFAFQAQACAKRAEIGFADLVFADVVIEARVVGYRADRQANIAFLELETLQTLRGFAKAYWSADLRPTSARVPDDNIWKGPVLIPLRGRITESGEFTATVIDKPCAPVALMPTDRGAGRALKADLQRSFSR